MSLVDILFGFTEDAAGFKGIKFPPGFSVLEGSPFVLVVRLQYVVEPPLIVVGMSNATFGQLKFVSIDIASPGLHIWHSPELKHLRPFGTVTDVYIPGFGFMVTSAVG